MDNIGQKCKGNTHEVRPFRSQKIMRVVISINVITQRFDLFYVELIFYRECAISVIREKIEAENQRNALTKLYMLMTDASNAIVNSKRKVASRNLRKPNEKSS